MTNNTIMILAERVEAAEGFSSELDEAIAAALGWIPFPRYGEDRWQNPATLMVEVLRPYTASIDAAMTLVPEGHEHNWSLVGCETLGSDGDASWQADVCDELADAATPALALCAAALKARAHD